MYGRDHITLHNTDPCKTQHPQLDPGWANVCGKTRCRRCANAGPAFTTLVQHWHNAYNAFIAVAGGEEGPVTKRLHDEWVCYLAWLISSTGACSPCNNWAPYARYRQVSAIWQNTETISTRPSPLFQPTKAISVHWFAGVPSSSRWCLRATFRSIWPAHYRGIIFAVKGITSA